MYENFRDYTQIMLIILKGIKGMYSKRQDNTNKKSHSFYT